MHVVTVTNLKQFKHQEDEKCLLHRGVVGHIRELHLGHHSQWQYQQQELGNEVRKAMG
jgi:hypothetical protein